MIVDTHVHLSALDAAEATSAYIDRAVGCGVTRMVSIGGDLEGNARSVVLAGDHPDCVYASVGFDRDLAGQDLDYALLNEQVRSPGVVAVGETGLDYHYGPDTRDEQMALFREMLGLASEVQKPVVVHSREADSDTLDLLAAHVGQVSGLSGRAAVLHCFTGGAEFAQQLVDLGIFISFSGIVTFRNAEALRAVAAALPEESIVIETDAPYLAPVPMRGKQNEPAYVRHVAECLAEVRGCSVAYISELTTRNACRLFGWDA